MYKLLHQFQFEIKLLKVVYFIPFIAYITTFLLMFWAYRTSSDLFLPYIFLQGISIPLAGWHLLFLYSSIYDERAREILMPYYSKEVGTDILRYSLVHGFIIVFFAITIVWMNGIAFFTPVILLHLVLLFIFYQLIGLALLTLVRNLEITLAIIATYTFTEVVTQGTFMPWPHLFLFMEPFPDIWLKLTFIFLILGIGWSLFQIWKTFK